MSFSYYVDRERARMIPAEIRDIVMGVKALVHRV